MTPEEAKSVLHEYLLKDSWALEADSIDAAIQFIAEDLGMAIAVVEGALMALIVDGYVSVNENGPLVRRTPSVFKSKDGTVRRDSSRQFRVPRIDSKKNDRRDGPASRRPHNRN